MRALFFLSRSDMGKLRVDSSENSIYGLLARNYFSLKTVWEGVNPKASRSTASTSA